MVDTTRKVADSVQRGNLRRGGVMTGNFNSDDLLKLVSRIYEAPLDRELWPVLLNSMADVIGAESTHLMVVNQSTGEDSLGFLERQDPATHREYMEDFFPQDIRVPRLAVAPVGAIIRDQNVWTPEERAASPLYHDYQRVHKLFHITGVQLGIEEHLTWLGFSRNHDSPFEERELRLIDVLAPHFRQAARLSLELSNRGIEKQILGEVLAASGRGIFILTPAGKVTFANREAEDMRRDGAVRVRGNQLSFGHPALNALLAANLAALRNGTPCQAANLAGLASAPDGEQTGVRFMAVTGESGALCSGAALVVMLTSLSREPRPSDLEVVQFGCLFALTPSELAVVSSMASGEELSLHARKRGIRPDTARKQMKSILAKANCRSQKELVRLIERFCFLRLR